jgi:hypothetical protein
MRKIIKIIMNILLILIGICIISYLLLIMVVRPSNDRNWNDDQILLPYAEFTQSATSTLVNIRNIRNFTYRSTSDYTPAYYDKRFDLDKLKRVWFIVEPFSGFAGAAHTFVSFEFEKDPSSSDFISISVEIRKQKGESFSALKGLLRQYELMYVVADEKDVIKLRSNYRKDQVYVYPIKADKAKAQQLFLDMAGRINKLANKPEFYNTLTNTCTTNIVDHVNKISPKRIPFSKSILLPASSDQHAYDIGLIDTDLSFEDARKKFLINDRAMKYADDPNFSEKIRAEDN